MRRFAEALNFGWRLGLWSDSSGVNAISLPVPSEEVEDNENLQRRLSVRLP